MFLSGQYEHWTCTVVNILQRAARKYWPHCNKFDLVKIYKAVTTWNINQNNLTKKAVVSITLAEKGRQCRSVAAEVHTPAASSSHALNISIQVSNRGVASFWCTLQLRVSDIDLWDWPVQHFHFIWRSFMCCLSEFHGLLKPPRNTNHDTF